MTLERARNAAGAPMAFVIKTAIDDAQATGWSFAGQKTMYGGKRIAVGDTVFVIASENEGGPGLIARGVVTAAREVPKAPGMRRQTPCVDVEVRVTAHAGRPLGRSLLKRFADWNDGRPETELNFKLYRQATNKIVGVSGATATLLASHF